MSWSAALTSVTTQGGNVVPSVTYTNSVTNETQVIPYNSNNITPAQLANQVAAYIDILNNRDASAAALSAGPITPVPFVQPPASADNFFALLNTLKQVQRAVAYGLLAANDPSVTAAIANAKAAFLPVYMSDPRWG